MFQGLGKDMAASFRRNTQLLLEKLQEVFRRFHLDRRLVKVDLTEKIVSGIAYRTLWGEISPALAAADRYDLASRLVFLSYCRG